MRPVEVDAPAGISVVTATVGRPETMLRKATSLAAQTLDRSRWEWLIAFDGAQPEVASALAAAVGDDMAVRTVTTGGVGPGPARDAACRLARYPVLLLSDDDCLLHRDALERHVAAQRVPGVYLGTVVFSSDDGDIPQLPPARPGWWHLGGANASLPTGAYRRVGGFGHATEGYGGEDLWLGWRLHSVGVPFRGLPEARVVHLGPDPQRSGDARKAYQAGANAVRIARREPALAWRLGVHPVLLTLKTFWLAPRGLGPERKRRSYEREYARGARAAWRDRPAHRPPPDGPRIREDEP